MLDPERSEPVEVVDDVNTSVVAALVAEDDVLLLEAAAEADVEGVVPPAVLVDAVSATVKDSGVLVCTALAVLDVDGDELLDPARAEVLLGSGVDVAMNPVVLDDVDVKTLVLTAVVDDDGLLLNTCVDGVGVAVSVILRVVDDVNTSVVAALVTEDDVPLLEAAVEADVAVLVPPAVLGIPSLPPLRAQVCSYSLRLQCLMLTATSCSMQLGQKCCWAQVLTSP